MSKPQSAQIFAALFAFFGFYFFHCTEAKAEAAYSSTQTVHFYLHQGGADNAQLGSSKAFAASPDSSKWFPWAFTIPEIIECSSERSSRSGISRIVYFVSAKYFYIRTGLSPPRLFI
jgi:hypothetical protein